MTIEEEMKKGIEGGETTISFDTFLNDENKNRQNELDNMEHFEESSVMNEEKEEVEDVPQKVFSTADDDEDYDCDYGIDSLLSDAAPVKDEGEEESGDKEEGGEEGGSSFPAYGLPSYDEEKNFETVDDGDFLDPQEEALLYSAGDDSVTYDEMSDSEGGKSDDDEDVSLFDGEKKPYQEIGGKPGKLLKGRLGLVIAGFFLITFICVSFFVDKKEKDAAAKANAKEDDLYIDGYNPNFGDYKSRAYKGEDVDDDALARIEAVLGGEDKEPYVPPEPVPEPPRQQAAAVSSSQPVNDRYQERVEAGLRTNAEGFGYSTRGSGYMTSGNGSTGGYQEVSYADAGYGGDYAAGYMSELNSIKDSLGVNGGNSGNAKVDTKRSFNDGNYLRGGSTSVETIPDNSLYPGTIIHAVMINGINTDYPGNITARVINNVYDSKTGSKLLIPSGSILRGSYSSASIGLNRIQIAWQTLILNRDGRDYIVDLGSMVGVDKSGYSGIKGTLNDHAFSYLKAAGISSLFTYINSNIFEVTNAQKNKTVQEMIAGSQEIGNKLADKILDRALDIEPTVKVRPGTRISVDVDKVLTLVPYERDMPVQKYIRK